MTDEEDLEIVLAGKQFYECYSCEGTGVSQMNLCFSCHGSGKTISARYKRACESLGVDLPKAPPRTQAAWLIKQASFAKVYGMGLNKINSTITEEMKEYAKKDVDTYTSVMIKEQEKLRARQKAILALYTSSYDQGTSFGNNDGPSNVADVSRMRRLKM